MSGLPAGPPFGPDEHQALARQLRLPGGYKDLLVLSRNSDPFYRGTPAHRREARWFRDLWERFGYTIGVHLRRIHYQVLSTGGQTPAGDPYENTEVHQGYLNSAGRSARMFDQVDVEAFEDRRNAPPKLNVHPRDVPAEPGWSAGQEQPDWELPAIYPFTLHADFRLPGVRVDGYDYDPADQPVLLEVWIEKSTMNDVLVPLCRELNVNLVVGVGHESITAVVGLLRRAERHGKRAHVLYISDFDPAGEQMPVAVARQAQFWAARLGIDVELSVEPVAVTLEQVAAYALPRVPIKDTDRRRARFEARNGQGAVELDALEALHPGVLAELVRHGVHGWRDAELPGQLARAEQQAQAAADRQWRERTADLRGDLAELERDVRAVTDSYRERLAALGRELAADLEPYRERLDELAAEAAGMVEDFDPDLPARPEPAEPDVDRSGLLYDSRRHWWEQLQAFKAAKSGQAQAGEGR